MRIHLTYFGPPRLFEQRVDLLAPIQASLTDLGHRVELANGDVDSRALNIIVSGYFASGERMRALATSGIAYGHIGTEIVGEGMLNGNPKKTDFAAYRELVAGGLFAWEMFTGNIEAWRRQGVSTTLLRWGYHPTMADVPKDRPKTLDYFFYGSLSPRRRRAIARLHAAGFKGQAVDACVRAQRNGGIARAKVQLNLTQADKYSHACGLRLWTLAANGCAILSEPQDNVDGWMDLARVAAPDHFPAALEALLEGDAWIHQGEMGLEIARRRPLGPRIAELMDTTLRAAA